MKTYLCYCSLFCEKICASDIDSAAAKFQLKFPQFIGVPYYIQLIYDECMENI